MKLQFLLVSALLSVVLALGGCGLIEEPEPESWQMIVKVNLTNNYYERGVYVYWVSPKASVENDEYPEIIEDGEAVYEEFGYSILLDMNYYPGEIYIHVFNDTNADGVMMESDPTGVGLANISEGMGDFAERYNGPDITLCPNGPTLEDVTITCP